MWVLIGVIVGGAAGLAGLGALVRFLFYGSAEAVGRVLGQYDKMRRRRGR